LSKNFQRQSCSAINYLSSGVNILAGNDPILVKFKSKGSALTFNRKDAHFTRGAVCSLRWQTFLFCFVTMQALSTSVQSSEVIDGMVHSTSLMPLDCRVGAGCFLQSSLPILLFCPLLLVYVVTNTQNDKAVTGLH